MEQLYIGIDMGGTKCAVVAGHADGKILRRIAFPSGKDAHPDEFLPRFYEAIDALLREYNGGCCFSKRMRKVFKKNEKSMLQFCNKNSKKKRAFTMG